MPYITYYCISALLRYVRLVYSSSMFSSIGRDALLPIITQSVTDVITVTVCIKYRNY